MEAATGSFRVPKARTRATRRIVLAFSALVLGLSAFAAPADAATALGETESPYTPLICTGPSTYLQVSTGQAPSYTVPAGGGVITSWSTFAPLGGAVVKLGVFRPAGPPQDTYTTVGASPPQTLVAGSLNSFATRHPGAGRGHAWAADRVRWTQLRHRRRRSPERPRLSGRREPCSTSAPSTPTTTRRQPARRINVAATVEADADGDGIGDEPPTTKITKGAPNETKEQSQVQVQLRRSGASFLSSTKRRKDASP